MAKFDERLKALRKEKRLSQDELAEALNVTKGTISVWERGIRKPEIKKLEEIAKYYEVTLAYILDNDDVDEDTNRTTWGEDAFEVEELEEISLMLTRLSRSSRRIVEGTIKAAYELDKESGQLKPKGVFDVVINKRINRQV